MTERRDDISGLHSLKGGHSYLPAEGPDVSILEAFPNRFPERRYVVSISFPEFTSLCPVTGQPDFGTIVLEYVPAKLCVESKSFKLYMFAYRNHHSFMETITNNVLNDIVTLLDPDWCGRAFRASGLYLPAAGAADLHEFVREWKMEPDPHRP